MDSPLDAAPFAVLFLVLAAATVGYVVVTHRRGVLLVPQMGVFASIPWWIGGALLGAMVLFR